MSNMGPGEEQEEMAVWKWGRILQIEKALGRSLCGRNKRHKELEQWQRALDESEEKTYSIQPNHSRGWVEAMKFPPRFKPLV